MVNSGSASLGNEHPFFSGFRNVCHIFFKKRQGVKGKYRHTPKGNMGDSTSPKRPGPQAGLPGPLMPGETLSPHATLPSPVQQNYQSEARMRLSQN